MAHSRPGWEPNWCLIIAFDFTKYFRTVSKKDTSYDSSKFRKGWSSQFHEKLNSVAKTTLIRSPFSRKITKNSKSRSKEDAHFTKKSKKDVCSKWSRRTHDRFYEKFEAVEAFQRCRSDTIFDFTENSKITRIVPLAGPLCWQKFSWNQSSSVCHGTKYFVKMIWTDRNTSAALLKQSEISKLIC